MVLVHAPHEGAPRLHVLDELDGIVGARAEGEGAAAAEGAGDAGARLLAAILTEMDGLDAGSGAGAASAASAEAPAASGGAGTAAGSTPVGAGAGAGAGGGLLVVATTNRPGALDPALTRPGRLDVSLHVPPPDAEGRAEVLAVHTRGIALAQDADLAALARDFRAGGMTGADLRGVVREAAMSALREDMSAPAVAHRHLEAALAAAAPAAAAASAARAFALP